MTADHPLHPPLPPSAWPPPHPATRVDGPSPLSSAPLPSPHRGGRRRWTMAACVAGFVIGASVAVAAVGHHDSSSSASSASSTTAAPAVTVPAATVPSAAGSPVTIPANSDAPATDEGAGDEGTPDAPASPATTPTTVTSVPATIPQRTSTTSDLTRGLVNIYTVLGFQQSEAAGTGIVLTSSGEVLTNNHVISGATKITVQVVATGKSYTASVVGTDPADDVAVLQLSNAKNLATATIGDSSTVRVGDQVVGVGNAGGTGQATTSPGYVSALGQTITATDESGGNSETLHNLIEIAASLQPGQSGGPLYDASGKVIGIDSAGSVNGRFRFRVQSTTGYAIPINDAMAIVKKIESGAPAAGITLGTPPLLGIGAQEAGGGGVLVTGVADSTPAAAIGLQAGDVITAVGGEKVTSLDDLSALLKTHKVGDKVTITWSSNGQTHSAEATLIAGPAD